MATISNTSSRVRYPGPGLTRPLFHNINNTKMIIQERKARTLDTGDKLILSALVGSRGHGLHTPESDWDWRGVYVAPTSKILLLGINNKSVKWIEGNGVDDTAYEIGKFLHLATKSNPSILEILASDTYDVLAMEDPEPFGALLLGLFPYLWSSKGVYDAFGGYSKNQEKKFLDRGNYDRRWKYAVAYLRVLRLGIDLLSTGYMSLRIEDEVFKQELRDIKNGLWGVGVIMDYAEKLRDELEIAYKNNPDKKTNMEPVNEFLLDLRMRNW